MLGDEEGRDERLTDGRERELFEIKLGRFAQVCERLFDRLALRGRVGLRLRQKWPHSFRQF